MLEYQLDWVKIVDFLLIPSLIFGQSTTFVFMFQISKPTSLDSSYIIDSVPPDQLMADRSSEEDDDDLEFTEEDLEILPDEDEDMMDTSNPMRSKKNRHFEN